MDNAEALPAVISAIRKQGTELLDQMLVREDMTIRQAGLFMPQSARIGTSIAEVLANLKR